MSTAAENQSWFHPRDSEASVLPQSNDLAFGRLWHGFMTARLMMAMAILLLQGLVYALGQQVNTWVLALCGIYLVATLAVRVLAQPMVPGRGRSPQWLITIGVDVLAFALLQWLQPSTTINYAPLFGLPLLLAAVLGSRTLALGTAASITLLLLGEAWWAGAHNPAEATARLLQAGLTGLGYFIVAFLANQLASRLAREEQLARRSESAARLQMQVSELVIETLSDGVLVVDAQGTARASNPAARALLGSRATSGTAFALTTETAWWPLQDLARSTLGQGRPLTADISIHHAGQSPRRVRVRTRLTSVQLGSGSLCVMFLHDLREMEARLRTEKLAAMGRMSAAVAHEIRNPLAAIVQANALLDEDLTDAAQKRLTLIVRQNAQRLAKIAEEVLDISRVQHRPSATPAANLPLDEAVDAVCRDWGAQASAQRAPQLALDARNVRVEFEADHLRRVLVNLLDNARRYISREDDALQVSTGLAASGQAILQVWSDGQPLEKSVEQHLFEPFFSSESRSTGLGLYICRELCARHGAVISYQRALRTTRRGPLEGNAFIVAFRRADASASTPLPIDTIVV